MLRSDPETFNSWIKKWNYPIIEGWDINRILSLAPYMNAPVHILNFEGIPCSVHGSPLILKEGKYMEVDKNYNKKQHEIFRSKGRVVKIVYKNNNMEPGKVGNRYMIAGEKSGILHPIIEVTNHGRSILRCKQWAKILQYAFDEKTDLIVLDTLEYNKLLKELNNNLII